MRVKSLSILTAAVLAVGLGIADPSTALAADELNLLDLAPPGGDVSGLTTGSMGPGNSIQATLYYRLESGKKGKIGVYTAGVSGNPSHTGVEIPIFVDKGKETVRTRFSVKCESNSPPVTPILKLRYVLFEVGPGGAIVRTLAEKFKDVNYKFHCAQKPAGQPAHGQPDLVVKIAGPATASAGDDIGPAISVEARNVGGAPAPGTTGALDPPNGYMIDLVLSTDTSVPASFATYSANFSEDVLLQGGRISNTADLAPGATKAYPTGAGIPADTPAGAYFLCARIDSGNKVAESNEGNNLSCARIKIKGKGVPTRGKPDLVIKAFGLKDWGKCTPGQAVFTFQVTVANIGTEASPAVPGMALVQAKDTHAINWGQGAFLAPIPPGGSQTVMIPVAYLMSDPGHMTAAAPHPFKAFADPLHLVDELNEGNNESAAINVDPRRICQGAGERSDLGMYGFLKIGKQQKQVKWGETITLTPADATLISGGKPAFEVYYAYREYNGVAVPGPFKNKIFFNGDLVSQQTGLSTDASEIKNVHTQAYLGPQNGQLQIKVDADDEVSEAREDNNFHFTVNLQFSGF